MSVSVYISPPRAKKLGSEASGLSESRVKRKAEKALSFVPGWSEWSSRGRTLMQLENNMKLWQGLGSALLQLGTPPEALRLISSPLASPEQVPALMPTTQTSRHPGQHAVTSARQHSPPKRLCCHRLPTALPPVPAQHSSTGGIFNIQPHGTRCSLVSPLDQPRACCNKFNAKAGRKHFR